VTARTWSLWLLGRELVAVHLEADPTDLPHPPVHPVGFSLVERADEA
jgi:hypothetical protein